MSVWVIQPHNFNN